MTDTTKTLRRELRDRGEATFDGCEVWCDETPGGGLDIYADDGAVGDSRPVTTLEADTAEEWNDAVAALRRAIGTLRAEAWTPSTPARLCAVCGEEPACHGDRCPRCVDLRRAVAR